MLDVVLIIALFAMPALYLRGEAHIKLIRVVSPVVLCYGTGIALGNMPGVAINTALVNQVIQATVVLAIPLLLFPSDMRGFWALAPSTAISFTLAIVSITLTSMVGVWLFGDRVADSWMVSAMLVGVYTGGTPNMTAIALSLEVPEELFILVNAADLFLGSIYLLFLMTVAKRILGKFYKPFAHTDDGAHEEDVEMATGSAPMRSVLTAFLLSAGIVGAAIGLSHLLTGGESAPVIILSLTTLAIGASFMSSVRSLQGSYEFGQYLMLVFCLGIGMLANLQDLVSAMSNIVGYATFILVGALVLHFALAKLFDIDVDTLIITTTAAVFGPPFIGPIAGVLKNRAVVVGGMTAGVIGLAIGNYLGYAVGIFLQP